MEGCPLLANPRTKPDKTDAHKPATVADGVTIAVVAVAVTIVVLLLLLLL